MENFRSAGRETPELCGQKEMKGRITKMSTSGLALNTQRVAGGGPYRRNEVQL
jgi:hypothetical protein